MHFSNLFAGLALASAVVAAPHYGGRPHPPPPPPGHYRPPYGKPPHPPPGYPARPPYGKPPHGKPPHPPPGPPTPPAPGCPAPQPPTPSSSAVPPPSTPSDVPEVPSPEEPSLKQAMLAQGREFMGTALTLRPNETREAEIIQQNFNSITPENAMKWESTEPSRGNFTFEGGDALVAFAKEYDLELHCHTLVWHSQLPEWVSQGGFSNETLLEVMEDHIRTLVTRWKGACTRWDVVNEALNEDGTYRESVWYNTIGEAYLPIAFQLARKYDANAQLYYNDYNLEYNAEKTQGAARIVKLIQSYGIEINAVGYQGHVTSEETPSAGGKAPEQSVLEAALRTTADLGVDVAYTEIDVRLLVPTTEESRAEQVATWERMAASCLAVEECIGMTVWGISDKYSWIPGVFEGEGDALLWDENYVKKPTYDGFLEGITG